MPIPVIVITVEKSRHISKPHICAFMPDGHVNFGPFTAVDDEGFLLHVLPAMSVAVGGEPSEIGGINAGIDKLRQ